MDVVGCDAEDAIHRAGGDREARVADAHDDGADDGQRDRHLQHEARSMAFVPRDGDRATESLERGAYGVESDPAPGDGGGLTARGETAGEQRDA